MNYEVKTKTYTGPLDKLLDLIEEKKLDITLVSIAQVTGDFMDYIKSLQAEGNLEVISDFIVIASKLLLIKSKALLPDLELTQEEEKDIHDLEYRLKIYKEFKGGAQLIKEIWHERRVVFGRELFANLSSESIFYPAGNASAESLYQTTKRLVSLLMQILPETTEVKRNVVTLEEKIHELLHRFQNTSSHSFKELSKEKTKGEIVIFFLAVLHLLKDRLIQVEQGSQFSDIILKKEKQESGSMNHESEN